jgi:hypothetical protein
LKGTAMQNTDYQIIDRNQTKELAKFLSQEGQFLLPNCAAPHIWDNV